MEGKESKTITAVVIAAVVLIIGGLGAWAIWGGNDDSNDTSTEVSSSESADESEATLNIVETAAADDQFSTLVAAVEAAGLVDTLSGEGPFTVFAPTNAAFDKLPEGTLEDLLSKPEELAAILKYHVVSGEVLAADVVNLSEATTVNGAAVPIMVDGDTVKVGDATVTKTDIKTSNGVIHVIDTVLIP